MFEYHDSYTICKNSSNDDDDGLKDGGVSADTSQIQLQDGSTKVNLNRQ